MQRREFLKTTAAGAACLALPAVAADAVTPEAPAQISGTLAWSHLHVLRPKPKPKPDHNFVRWEEIEADVCGGFVRMAKEFRRIAEERNIKIVPYDSVEVYSSSARWIRFSNDFAPLVSRGVERDFLYELHVALSWPLWQACSLLLTLHPGRCDTITQLHEVTARPNQPNGMADRPVDFELFLREPVITPLTEEELREHIAATNRFMNYESISRLLTGS